MPYAQGIVQGEAINKCPPGGDETIAGLARLLKVPVLPVDAERGVAPAQVAFIREAECIGCTKCIQACPVDAIVGAAKLMHTVIVDECTGCDLCVAPCPVDCIDMLPIEIGEASSAHSVPLVGGLAFTPEQQHTRSRKRDHARRRFESRNARLRQDEERRLAERLARAQRAPTGLAAPQRPSITERQGQISGADDAAIKKARGALAMSRAQLNKSLKAFGHPPIAEQAARLVELQHEYETAEHSLNRLLHDKPAEAVPVKTDNGDIKRAKIQLAMARAALQKAQATQAPAEQIAQLSTELQRIELLLERPGRTVSETATPLVSVTKETHGL